MLALSLLQARLIEICSSRLSIGFQI